MKVTVDPEICRGHALCIGIAPEVFDFDDDQDVAVVVAAAARAAPRELMERAVACCPEGAIAAERD